MRLLEVLGLYGRCFVDTEDLALVAASQGGPRRSYSREPNKMNAVLVKSRMKREVTL